MGHFWVYLSLSDSLNIMVFMIMAGKNEEEVLQLYHMINRKKPSSQLGFEPTTSGS